MSTGRTEAGFALISVVVVLSVLVAVAALIATESPFESELVKGDGEHARALYVAEAGLRHALWQANASGCGSYQALPDTPFGGHSYRAFLSPTTGSPVTIKATGTLANGAERTLMRTDARIYDTPQTITLQLSTDPGEDTLVDGFYPLRNYGGALYVQISSQPSWIQRPLLRFDLSAIPAGAKIVSAELELRMWNVVTEGTATVHAVSRPWIEGTRNGGGQADGATWGTYDAVNAWSQPGADFAPEQISARQITVADDDQWVDWEISPLVADWVSGKTPNYGLLLQGDGVLRQAQFASRDTNNPLDAPKLTITYACECGAVCSAGAPPNLLFVAVDPAILTAQEIAKIALIESWGYVIQVIGAADSQANFDAAVSDNDVVFITEDVNSGTLNTKLTMAPIGVVTEEDNLSDEFGMASGIVWDNGSSLTITDNTHYISSPFELGHLTIMSISGPLAYMQGTLSTELDQLADSPAGQPSLVALEAGAAMAGGGTAAGRRALLPWGGNDFDFSTLNANGRLILQRALEWGAADPPPVPQTILLVVPDATNLDAQDAAKESLIAGWGFTVALISAIDTQANFDAAIAFADAAYISENVLSTDLGTKLRNATIGVVNEEGALYDEFGIASNNGGYTASVINVANNTHYITSPFDIGAVTITTTAQELKTLAGTIASGANTLADSGSASTLVTLEKGALLVDTGTAAGRRVILPWGGNAWDINTLNANGRTIMKRALEWAADSDSGSGSGTSSGPVAHWKLDDGMGGTAIDSSGNGHHGSLVGNPTWTGGIAGGALDLDGFGDYVNGGNVLAAGTPEMSVTAWVLKRDTGDDRIVTKSSGTAISDHIFSLGVANTTIRVRLRTTDNGGTSNYDGGTIPLNQWTHLAFTYDGTTLRLYRDGSQTASFGVTGTVLASGLPVALGNVNTTQDRYLNGRLDDVQIYDRALGPEEIAALSITCNGAFEDDFGSGGYAGSTGSQSWATSWLEINESDGPTWGDEQVVLSDATGSLALRVRDNDGGGEGVQRELDLSPYTNATLTFVYVRSGLDTSEDYVALELSADGGDSWTEVSRLAGPANDLTLQEASFDISGFIAANTRIRLISSPTMGGLDAVYFDDVKIAATGCAGPL